MLESTIRIESESVYGASPFIIETTGDLGNKTFTKRPNKEHGYEYKLDDIKESKTIISE